ncbi:oligopeptide ABC transporter permease [Sporolactobacillus kofuensis]|uniref:Oligopeptide ABC transporter permease n=1 Tax=Sporolactobacillus kofuensis TaxID=269672 RepID=A0ABW1WF25_9BACL|nr:oligopeptide ABC transporter permease [Sporolactobacillus kofuensis]MCO7174509.1 ABC transporter permease [Sporolactobacillus kofuensis]
MAAANESITKDMFLPAELDQSANEKISGEVVSVWKDAFRRFVQNKGAVASLIIVIAIVLMALIGPHLNNYGPTDQDLNRSNLPPRIAALSWLPFFSGKEDGIDVYQQHGIKKDFWFGTDQLGRDLWSRTWDGTQISLIIALIATLVDVFIGVTYGGISGYFGGRTDNILQRILEIISGIPSLVWIILLILVMKPGLIPITIAIMATNWIAMARIVRGEMLKLKNQEFVLASTSLGASHSRIIFKHMIPNSLGMIIINTMFSIPSAIFFEAFLSFIGLGIREPQASLGSLINSGYEVLQLHPYQTVYPGLVICLLLIAFNLIGNGLRDAFDPKLRH